MDAQKPDDASRSRHDASQPIHVVAGVVRDACGRILLAQRVGQRDLAGLWEFPGGKVEPGESAVAALARELHEEVGITIDTGSVEPLIAIAHRSASGKRIHLDVHQVGRHAGQACGMEAQAITWVARDRLAGYAMPGADLPVVAALCQPDLHLHLSLDEERPQATLGLLDVALRTGSRRVRLDARGTWLASRMLEHAVTLAASRAAELQLALGEGQDIDAGVALAQALRLGVHLDPPLLSRITQRPLPPDLPVTATCRDLADLHLAQRIGLDSVVLDAGHGRAELRRDWREQVVLPIHVATASIAPDMFAALRAQGAQGIAMPLPEWILAQPSNPVA